MHIVIKEWCECLLTIKVSGFLVITIFSVRKFLQNACQGHLCYDDLTYEVSKWKAVLKFTAAM